MPIHSPRSGTRDLGVGARLLTGASLLAAGVVYAVTAPDPIGGLVFSGLLLAGKEFPVFRMFRGMSTTLSSGLLVLTGLVPILEFAIRRTVLAQPFAEYWHLGFAHLVMVLTLWRFQHRRLVALDHLSLLGVGLLLIGLGTRGGWDPRIVPLVALWCAPAALAFSRVFVMAEEQRVLDLARVRGFLRDEAEEVSGREGVRTGAMYGLLLTIAFWAFAGGLLLTWSFPHVTAGIDAAWSFLIGEEEVEEEEGMGLPEHERGLPPFEIPPGVVGYLPFGDRLERDEFNRRLALDGVTLLTRPTFAGQGAGPDPFIRGECYDFLASDGRWIQSRAQEKRLPDISDGTQDGWVVLPGKTVEADYRAIQYLLPAGPDRTIYALAVPTRIDLPSVATDGTGNLLFTGSRAHSSPYVVKSKDSYLPEGTPLADPGPEFHLLPAGVDAGPLRTLANAAALTATDRHERVRFIAAWMRSKLIHLDTDEPPPTAAEGERPDRNRLDVQGFLFERKWGRNIDFATAFAMLLRADGIPCRLATGYRKGEWLRDADFRVFRSYDLYAWVEVPFMDGYGWVPFDPTPPVLEMEEEELEKVFSLPPEERADELEKIETSKPTVIRQVLDAINEFVTSLLPGDRKESGIGRLVAWGALLLAVALLLRFVIFAVDRGRRLVRSRALGSEKLVLLPFYSNLLKMLAARGMRRRTSETPLEFARKVIENLGQDFGEVGRLTNAFCSIRYGGAVMSRGDEASLDARVQALADRLKERELARRAEFEARRQKRAKVPVQMLLMLALLLPAVAPPVFAQDPSAETRNLGDEDPEVRAIARERLLLLGRAAVPELVRALSVADPASADREVAALIRALDSDRFAERERASEKLMAFGPGAIPLLEDASVNGSPEVRRRALAILEHLRTSARAELLSVEAEERRRRSGALDVLGLIGGPSELEPVVQAALTWPELRPEAILALTRMAPRAAEQFVALIERPDPAVCDLAITALSRCRAEELRPWLRRLITDPDPSVRRAALAGLVTAEVVEKTDRARLNLIQAETNEAEALLREVLDDCPGYPEAGIVLAKLLRSAGRDEDALAVLMSLALPEVEKAVLVVPVQIAAGKASASLEHVSDLLNRHDRDPRLYVLAAKVYLAADPPQPRLAMARLQTGLQIAPEELELWFLSGKIRGEHLDDPAGARRDLFEAMQIDSQNEDVRAAYMKYSGR